MRGWKPISSVALPALLALSLSACDTQPKRLPMTSAPQVQRPPLPAEAMQPPDPDWCQPSCLEALRSELRDLANALSSLRNSRSQEQ